jgi:alcohol dehydrogenase class IV
LRTDLFYGIGSTDRALELIDARGYKSAYLAVDRGVASHSPYFQEVVEKLRAKALQISPVELRSDEEPSYDYLSCLAEDMRARKGLDLVIGIGGGSALDVAKALAALYTNPGDPIVYRGFDKLNIPNIDSIIIPSTAGTGSEVTVNAVFTDKDEMRKLGINGRFVEASYAVLDAKWTMSCPFPAAQSAGIDAMVHAIESFMTANANPMTRAISTAAFSALYSNLPCLVDDPDNVEKRQQLLLGAYLAGAALFNAGSGVAGALSYPIGVHYKVPHGIAGGIFLASVVRFNVDHGYGDYADLLDAVEQHPGWTRKDKAARFADAIQELCDRIKIPRTLRQWGIRRADIDKLIELCGGLQPAFDQNPLPFKVDQDVRCVLERHTD